MCVELEETIRILFPYSLAKRSSNDDAFSIHPLVHSWARLRLKPKPQKEIEIARDAFEILASGVYNSDDRPMEDWIFERRVMPHIDNITMHMAKYVGIGNMSIQDESRGLGHAYAMHGQYDEALEWYGRALTG